MNCSACGKANADGVSFCEYCGANMHAQSATTPVAAAPYVAPAAPAQPAAPSASEVAQLGKSFLNSLSLGEKFVGVGVIASVVGFFLPWVSSPDLGDLGALLGPMAQMGSTHVSLSGLDVAKFVGAVYFILLAAIAAGILLYFSKKAATAHKLLMAGFQVLIGSLFGPGFIGALFFIPMIQSVSGAGFWLVGLGYCSIAAGGLITIGTMGKTVR
jgi:hypothetical protein